MTRASFIARTSWLRREGLRIDAGAYASGAMAAREAIVDRGTRWLRLDDVASVFYPGRFARRYVRDDRLGTTFLSSSDMLLADLHAVPLLRNSEIERSPDLVLGEGWTLISRSGSIGNTAFVRGEMQGMAASEHVIRVVPQGDGPLGGFLFAFLSSRAGQALLKSQTYGTIIQHIEPHHIADLPVPLPDAATQQRIHALVTGAAAARTEASRLLDQAAAYFDGLVGPMRCAHDHARAAGVVRRSRLNMRLDAFHHVGWAAKATGLEGDSIEELATVFGTNRVPRIYVKRGVPFFSGVDIFKVRPQARFRLAVRIADAFDARLNAGELVVQGSGQRYGLVGRAAYVGERLHGAAASHDLFRIKAVDSQSTARIFAFLRSDAGRRSMLRHSYGTSIPHVNPAGIARVVVPRLPEKLLEGAARALALREQADADEERAIQEVESWLG